MSGPTIRGWQMARALSSRLTVTAAVSDPRSATRDGIRLVDRSRARLIREAGRHDAVVAPWVPAYLLARLAGRSTMTIADLYDPVEVEAGSSETRVLRRWAGTARRAQRLQLRFADLILCAGERQREAIAEELAALFPRPGERPDVLVVPFGLDPAPPAPARGALRAELPAIGADDPVILWWGSIWRWMDAETAIRAAGVLAERNPRVRLVFSAGRPPGSHVEPFAAASEARALAQSLGLLERSVFFLEEWIPYADRHEYLLDADVGLNLHRDPLEGALSVRARYMDFLWAGLPCVVTEGSELADRFGRAGFAAPVPIADVEATALALERLIEDDGARDRARAAAGRLVPDYRWETVAGPLADAIEAGAVRRVGKAGAAARAIAYYARRLGDRVYERFA